MPDGWLCLEWFYRCAVQLPCRTTNQKAVTISHSRNAGSYILYSGFIQNPETNEQRTSWVMCHVHDKTTDPQTGSERNERVLPGFARYEVLLYASSVTSLSSELKQGQKCTLQQNYYLLCRCCRLCSVVLSCLETKINKSNVTTTGILTSTLSHLHLILNT